MEITYIGLSECYREIIDRAQKSDYIWIMSRIARYADCENVYKKIEHDWESLNDLTGKKILFIFSSPSCKDTGTSVKTTTTSPCHSLVIIQTTYMST